MTRTNASGRSFATKIRDWLSGGDWNAGTRTLDWGAELKAFATAMPDAFVMGPTILSTSDQWRQNATVRASIEVIAATLAQRPFEIFRNQTDKVEKHPLIDLMRRPNPTLGMSEFSLKYQTIALYELFGECFWLTPRQGKGGLPTEIWIYHPWAVTELWNPATQQLLAWQLQMPYGGYALVDPNDVVHFARYDPLRHSPWRPSRGTSALESAGLVTTADIAAQRQNVGMFQRGLHPGGVITTKEDLGVETAEALLARIRAKLQFKPHEPLLLDNGTQWTESQISPKEADFNESRKNNALEICRALHVPPFVVGMTADYHNENSKAALRSWWITWLIPTIEALSTAIDTKLVRDPTLSAWFSVDDVEELQESLGDKLGSAAKLYELGVPYNAIEKLLKIGTGPIEGGDIGYRKYALVPTRDDVANKGDDLTPKNELPPSTNPLDEQPAKVITEPPPRLSISAGIRALLVEHELAAIQTRDDASDLSLITQIIRGDDEALQKLSRKYHVQGVEAGEQQIADLLGIDTLLSIDDPRVERFLETKANQITTVNETTADRIMATIREMVADGETPEDIAGAIKDIYNLRDSQATLIGRQEVGSALNGGRFLQMQDESVQSEEWLTARDSRVRDSHAAIDGETITLGGLFSNGLRYPQDPEGAPEETINCFPAETLVVADDVRRAYRARYSGQLVTIKTAFGHKLTGTPNHPILTERGFVSLGSIAKGDRVISNSLAQRVTARDPHVQRAPSRIDETFHAIARVGERQWVARRDVDFYGDRPDGDVDIASLESQLRIGNEAALNDPRGEDVLALSDLRQRSLLRHGGIPEPLIARWASTDGGIRSGSEGAALVEREARHAQPVRRAAVADLGSRGNESRPDGAARDSKAILDRQLGFPSEVRFDNLSVADVAAESATSFYSALAQIAAGGSHSDSEALDDLGQTLASDVVLDEVIDVSSRDWAGHIFTLQTRSGVYFADGILARNCRCIALPVIDARGNRAFDRAEYWRAAVANVRPIEKQFTRKLQSYFYDQRKRVLKALGDAGVIA